jgi:hypothetical protein
MLTCKTDLGCREVPETSAVYLNFLGLGTGTVHILVLSLVYCNHEQVTYVPFP